MKALLGASALAVRNSSNVSPLGSLVITLRKAIQDGDDGKALDSLQQLYSILIAPLLEGGITPQNFTRWIVVPHGMLHYIPFGALMDVQGRHLIQDVALAMAPSASVWLQLQSRAVQPVTSFLGLANPALPNVPCLPQAEAEMASIVKSLAALQTTIYQRAGATESRLRAEITGKGIVHFATHGDFPEADAIDFHRILLASTDAHDGYVNAEELRQMDLRAARLIALSICNGGVYRFGPGDEPYGLLAALLTAGAENVVGTLWPIEDRSGRTFMSEFYKHLLPADPAEALRRVCIQMLRGPNILRDWAGFVVVGPGRPLI